MKTDKQPTKRNGYEVADKEEEFIHRKRAYHIYLENRDKYPLPYSAYEVHHIDFDKTNNKVSNLQILTPTEHDKLHEEATIKKDRLRKEESEKRAVENQGLWNLKIIPNLKKEKVIKKRIKCYVCGKLLNPENDEIYAVSSVGVICEKCFKKTMGKRNKGE